MSITDIFADRGLSRNQQIALRLYKEQITGYVRTFYRNKPAVAGAVIVLGVILMALTAPYLAPYDPEATQYDENQMPKSLESPSLSNPMGTNHLGQDIFSQWLYGAQVSVLVAFSVGMSVLVIGTSVGLVAGYFKGIVDLILMRIVDILYGIPITPFILAVALIYKNSIWVVVFAMVAVIWRTMARVVRAQAMSLSERQYVTAAKSIGASDVHILYRHIAPNLVPLMLVEVTFVMGAAILIEAGISFLGLGATEMISWGVMLQVTFTTGAITHAWWWVIPPGFAITLLVVAFFYISRGIEDITNPDLEATDL